MSQTETNSFIGGKVPIRQEASNWSGRTANRQRPRAYQAGSPTVRGFLREHQRCHGFKHGRQIANRKGLITLVCVSNATRSVTKRKERLEIHQESSETSLEGTQTSRELSWGCQKRLLRCYRVSESHEGSQTCQDESQTDREASRMH